MTVKGENGNRIRLITYLLVPLAAIALSQWVSEHAI
jgi:hypothetical protein